MSRTKTVRATTTLWHAYKYLHHTYALDARLCPRHELFPVKVAATLLQYLHNIVLVLGDQTIEVEIE